MDSDDEEMFRRRQLAFTGKVLAGFTDQILNDLRGMQSSTDRLRDLLEQTGPRAEEDQQRFADILSTIERHLRILGKKNEHLNQYAQRTGTPLSTFDAGKLVEEVVSFSTRLARVRQVCLEEDVAEKLPVLRSDPVGVHFLVSLLINHMLERLDRGGKLILRARPVETGLLIEVEGHGVGGDAAISAPEAGNHYWPIGQEVAGHLGGCLEATTVRHDMKRISLFLPSEQVSVAP
jgi:C4-dicarboxylate-specific signal transduction histidine kinase